MTRRDIARICAGIAATRTGIALAADPKEQEGFRLGVASWRGLLSLQLVAATILIFVPTTLMGLIMPLVLRWTGAGPGGLVVRQFGG